MVNPDKVLREFFKEIAGAVDIEKFLVDPGSINNPWEIGTREFRLFEKARILVKGYNED